MSSAMIPVLDDVLGFVKSHPELFFPGGKPNGLTCANYLVAEIMALGGHDAAVRRTAGWWLVGSSTDWFGELEIVTLFHRLVPLPQLGPNTSRAEVIVMAYASNIATIGPSGGRVVIAGAEPPPEIWAALATGHARDLAFRFAADPSL